MSTHCILNPHKVFLKKVYLLTYVDIRAIRILPYRCLYPCKSVLIRESIFVDLGIRAIRLVVHAGITSNIMFPLLFC